MRIDYEVLGSNEGKYAFQTPLGTHHLLQGCADLFVLTPPDGLGGTYVTGIAKIKKTTLHAAYHQFKSHYGSLDFGDEIDLAVSFPFTKRLVGKIEYADCRAGDPASLRFDVTKFWFTLIFNY